MGARSGKQYLASLRANHPTVYLNGEIVEDLSTHPAFAGPVKTVMEQYDLQLLPENRDVCLYESPTTGDLVSTSFLMPRSREELTQRRRHFKLRSDHTFGFMGRAPDFMNAFTTGWGYMEKRLAAFKTEAGQNARRFYEHCRENDLFLTHVLGNPQIDRSKTSAAQSDPFLHLGRVGECAEGIIVRGAKTLGTMAPLTDEMLVAPFGGIAPGDDIYALTFAIPSNTPGLKFICREPINDGSRTHFDHPLSSRFEEMDCVVVFDDVVVPWNRLLIDGSPGSGAFTNSLVPDGRGGAMVQSTARLLSSLELFCGIATKLADSVGIGGFLHIQEKLGQILYELEGVKTAFYASDAMGSEEPDGYWTPYLLGLRAIHNRSSAIHAQCVEAINLLAGGGFFYAPTEADFDNPDIRPYIDKFIRGRPGVSAEERVRLFKLAWDVTGDAFGQRVRQYVRFYSGDPVRNTAGFYLSYNAKPLWDVVDRALLGSEARVPMPSAELTTSPPPKKSGALSQSYPTASHPVAPPQVAKV